MWHYMYGSKYDTPFWKAAGKLKIEHPTFDVFLEYAKKYSMIELLDAETDLFREKRYGQWMPWNFKNWYEAMT